MIWASLSFSNRFFTDFVLELVEEKNSCPKVRLEDLEGQNPNDLRCPDGSGDRPQFGMEDPTEVSRRSSMPASPNYRKYSTYSEVVDLNYKGDDD